MSGTHNDVGFKPSHNKVPTPDGGKSQEEYNTAHSRVPSAPTSGGSRGASGSLTERSKNIGQPGGGGRASD
jgi:hypothetical protein